MPLGSDASGNIAELSKAKKGQRKWPRKRIIAAGLNAAREHGGKVKPPRGKHVMPGGRMMKDKDMPRKKPKLQYLGGKGT